MSNPQQPSKAARIISSFFKPTDVDEPQEAPTSDEPEAREPTKKSFAKNVASAIVRRLGK